MPELPEVETTLRGITPHIKHNTILKIIIRQRQLRWPIPANLQQILRSQTILACKRRGKYILLKTHLGTIIIHLGMSGHLRILTKMLPPNKHDHVDIIFKNKKILRLTDPRRFGALLWTQYNPELHSLLKHLGPEPLSSEFSSKYLFMQAQNRKISIKAFIMDSSTVVGIGNIYATEALFAAGIRPDTPAQTLSITRLNKLVKKIKFILRCSIKKGGTTLKDFVNSQGKPGYFAQELKVYGRAGLPCVHCKETLQALRIGQRSTVYCKHCQK